MGSEPGPSRPVRAPGRLFGLVMVVIVLWMSMVVIQIARHPGGARSEHDLLAAFTAAVADRAPDRLQPLLLPGSAADDYAQRYLAQLSRRNR